MLETRRLDTLKYVKMTLWGLAEHGSTTWSHSQKLKNAHYTHSVYFCYNISIINNSSNKMKAENRILMEEARKALAGKWGLAVQTSLLYLVIVVIISSFKDAGSLISLLVSGPLAFGLSLFFISIARNKPAQLEQLFGGFKIFGRTLITYILLVIFTLLWTLLLIIPGIIAAISYSQTFFILIDDKTISPSQAIEKSKKMMYGYKWKYFCLGLRFLGWGLLSVITFGIGFIWLLPYVQVTMAKFYEDIKE